jgi:transcription elongation factor Elf1
VRTSSVVRPDFSQRVAFTCPECQTEGFTNLGATEEVEEVEVSCDYCERVVVVAFGDEHA